MESSSVPFGDFSSLKTLRKEDIIFVNFFRRSLEKRIEEKRFPSEFRFSSAFFFSSSKNQKRDLAFEDKTEISSVTTITGGIYQNLVEVWFNINPSAEPFSEGGSIRGRNQHGLPTKARSSAILG